MKTLVPNGISRIAACSRFLITLESTFITNPSFCIASSREFQFCPRLFGIFVWSLRGVNYSCSTLQIIARWFTRQFLMIRNDCNEWGTTREAECEGRTSRTSPVFCMLTDNCIFAVITLYISETINRVLLTHLLFTCNTFVTMEEGNNISLIFFFVSFCICNIVSINIYRLCDAVYYSYIRISLAAITVCATVIL